jgi:predicted phosphodiesterase
MFPTLLIQESPMLILVTADLHPDLWRRTGRDPFAALAPVLGAVDALVVAGDLTNNPLRNWPDALARLSRIIDPAKIHILPGNHDYYHFRLDGDYRLRAMVEDAGMTWAQKAEVVFGGVRFLCATLWTDFRLTGDEAAAGNAARQAMNDYRLILRNARSDILLPRHTAEVHAEHLAWLTDRIARPHAGPTVIVTHHGPSPCATGPIDRLTPAFSSDLDGWILLHKPDLWLFGHTHRRLAGQVGHTRIMNISQGYPGEVPEGDETDILLRGLIDTDAPGLLADGRKDTE